MIQWDALQFEYIIESVAYSPTHVHILYQSLFILTLKSQTVTVKGKIFALSYFRPLVKNFCLAQLQ